MEAKDEIKKRLRRNAPDRADAASLAIYEPPGSNASETKPPPSRRSSLAAGQAVWAGRGSPRADHVWSNLPARGSATPYPVC